MTNLVTAVAALGALAATPAFAQQQGRSFIVAAPTRGHR